jgi:hypothetical protein|tara:strand:- start:2542 stop:5346 length:2805 start_codon:yes stop_codon:yes gene_type:complete
MAGITQQVPNYIFGISEQPDELKIPGQVRDLKNALPDVTRGLLKRPGSVFKSDLLAENNSQWFNIYRDVNEQYIGQITSTGEVKVWDAKTGDQKTVTADPGTESYLAHGGNTEQVQVLSVNDFTFINNRTKTVQMSSSRSPNKVNQAFISVKQVKPGTQYALDISTPGSGISHVFNRATNIEISDVPYSTNSDWINDGQCLDAGRQLFNSSQTSNLSGYTRNTNVWFEIDSRCVGAIEPENGGDGESGYDTYTNTATLKFGGEFQSIGTEHNVTMTNSASEGDWEVKVTAVSQVSARANIGLIRPSPTPFEGLNATADSVIQGMIQQIVESGGWTTVAQIGNGIYLERSTPFVVTAPDESLLEIIQNSASDVGKLPSSCRHGMRLAITNSAEEEDDYYLEFVGDNGQDGPGVWEETIGPSLPISFDVSTMPVQLVRQANGDFTLETVEWDNRLVGDDNTNPIPSFCTEPGSGVPRRINRLVFFRNRLGIISDENVILSRAGDFFNFWSKTATTVTPIDPIDISCSSQTPAVLYEAIETNPGLVLFAENQQFIMTTDSDIFSPRTAKINSLSSYQFNVDTHPWSMGTTIGFLNNGGNNTRMFEMTGVNRDTEPQIIEQSKLVSKLLPKDLNLIASSKENTLVSLANKEKDEVWLYRYFNTGEKRVQSAWMRWEMTGNVPFHCIMDDVYYAVILNGTNYTLQAVDVRTTAGNLVADQPVHMDNRTTIAKADMTFDSAANTTSFNLPTGYYSSKKLALFATTEAPPSPAPDPSQPGKIDLVSPVSTGKFEEVTVDSGVITVDGDWTDTAPTLGYIYEMLVEFPTIYAQKKSGDSVRSDIRSSLMIHRVSLNLEDAGVYESTLVRKGKPDYTQLYECREQDGYQANAVAYAQNKDQSIPVYERNTNVTLFMKSSHPSPATLVSLNWEGDYNPRFYKSV